MDVRSVIWGILMVTFVCPAAIGQAVDTSSKFPESKPRTSVELLSSSDQAASADSLATIGYSHYGSNEYEKAAGAFRRAISLDPTNYNANLYLGYSYYYLTDFAAAATALKTATLLRPNDPEAQYWLATTLYLQHRYADAVPPFKQTVGLNTNQPGAWLYLGVCQFHLQDYQGAVDSLQHCTTAEPTNSFGQLWLGYSLARLGDYDRASAAFARAATLNPGDYDASYWHGLMLFRLRRFDGAIKPLEHALVNRPGDRSIRWLLFASYLSTGQVSKIPGLHLGLALPVSILLLCAYLPTLSLLMWQSLQVRANPAPGVLLSAGWFGAWVVGQIGATLVAVFAFSLPPSRALWLGICLSATPLIVTSVLGFARQPWGAPFAWPPRVPGTKSVLGGLAALAGALLFYALYNWLAACVTGKPIPSQLIAPWIDAAAKQELLPAFIAVGFLGPAAEEILFRGLLFGAVGKWLSTGWTVVVTAFLFAVIHLQLFYFVPIFVVGLMLGWVRYKSQGLVLPVLLHCINNSTALLIAIARRGIT